MSRYRIMTRHTDVGLDLEVDGGNEMARAIFVFETEAEAEALLYTDQEPEGSGVSGW